MPTLLLQLAGPMQSWGTRSRFDERDSELEPSKSGVIGLLCAALGIPRDRWDEAGRTPSPKALAALKMGVRVDKEGILRMDYHTAQNLIASDGKTKHATAVSRRFYLADACFLVGLEGEDKQLLETVHNALKNPVWAVSLGRKSFPPSRPLWLVDGLRDEDLRAALQNFRVLTPQTPWGEPKGPTRLLIESTRGSMRMDQPLSSFANRHFGSRFVESYAYTGGQHGA